MSLAMKKPLVAWTCGRVWRNSGRVRPGGTIVYSVCTVNRDEAEAVVDASGLEVDDSLASAWPARWTRRSRMCNS